MYISSWDLDKSIMMSMAGDYLAEFPSRNSAGIVRVDAQPDNMDGRGNSPLWLADKCVFLSAQQGLFLRFGAIAKLVVILISPGCGSPPWDAGGLREFRF
jgi:hypothetical protein